MNDFSSPRPAPRLYCELPLAAGARIELPERAAKHVQALRLRVGDALTLFSGDGREWAAKLRTLSKRSTEAEVGPPSEIERESPLEIHLLQGICAGDRMDLVLQKATELGVTSIQPLVTIRSIVRLSSDRQEKREAHWQNVVIAACEQCGRNRIPLVKPSLGLNNYLSEPPQDGALRILLSPDGSTRLRDLPRPTTPLHVLIGPEGGLAGDERQLGMELGFVSVRFGPRILRTETAPLAAMAAMQALWGDC
ncbi:MAG TPA: 16S rRNA (uracil(1498)-N(3))-methyltransferase [Burkholderiales bacterium]|nr:16S rRNA (uracil(1498)-N(3))-methyltransferase [Burkholderiales bacterium]